MMEENKEKKRLESVSHAVLKIKEKEEEKRQSGIFIENTEDTEEDAVEKKLAKTEIVEKEDQEDFEDDDFEKALEKEEIEDENLYESTDSTYESLFLSKSMMGKGESIHSPKAFKQNIPDGRVNTSTMQELQEIKKNLNKKTDPEPSFITKKELKEVEEAEKLIKPIPTLKDILPKEDIAPKEEQKKLNPEGKEEKNSKKNSALISSKEIQTSEKFLEGKKEKNLPEYKEKKSKFFDRKKESFFTSYSKIILGVIVFFFFFFILFSIFSSKKNTFSKDTSSKVASLSFVMKGNFIPILSVEGIVCSPQKEIYSQAQGNVFQILCKKGDIVKKGDSLIKLSNPLLDQELHQAKQSLIQAFMNWQEFLIQWDPWRKRQAQAREAVLKKSKDALKQSMAFLEKWISSEDKEFQKLEKSWKEKKLFLEENVIKNYKGLSSQENKILLLEWKYQSVHQALLASILQYKKKQQESQNLVIKASESGKIHAFFVEEGVFVSWGTKVASILLSKEKGIEAKIPYTYFPYIKNLSNQKLDAQIEFPLADIPLLQKEKIHISCIPLSPEKISTISIKFISPKEKISEDSFVSLAVVLPDKKNCLYVLKEAIVFQKFIEKSLPFVFIQKVDKESIIEKIPVVLGMENNQYVEILKGLSGGETVVIFKQY